MRPHLLQDGDGLIDPRGKRIGRVQQQQQLVVGRLQQHARDLARQLLGGCRQLLDWQQALHQREQALPKLLNLLLRVCGSRRRGRCQTVALLAGHARAGRGGRRGRGHLRRRYRHSASHPTVHASQPVEAVQAQGRKL